MSVILKVTDHLLHLLLFLVLLQYQDRCATSKALFIGEGCTPVDLQTQVIPFLALANVPLHDPGACFHILGTLILKDAYILSVLCNFKLSCSSFS